MTGKTIPGGAVAFTLTSLGKTLGVLSEKVNFVTANVDAGYVDVPVDDTIEGAERFVFHNVGVFEFSISQGVSVVGTVQAGELAFVGYDDTGAAVLHKIIHPEDGMSRITKTVLMSDLTTIGAVMTGDIVIGDLPVGGIPITLSMRRLQDTALDGSGAPITDLQGALISSGSSTLLTSYITGLNAALQPRGQVGVELVNGAVADLFVESPTPAEYSVKLNITGDTFDTLDSISSDEAVLLIELFYMR